MIDKETFSIVDDFTGAKGILFIGAEMVVIRRDGNTPHYPFHVDLPGGKREENESPFATFRREVFEELGVVVEQEDITFSKRYTSVIDPEDNAYLLVTRPLDIKVSDIVFGNEGLEFFLITPEKYIELNDGVRGQQERVRDFLTYSLQ